MSEYHKIKTREFEEVRIKVPWGFLAGKWYGPKDVRPILAIHGWQNNAGTFATLVPLMPSYIGVLCIDLPGHGLSSHLPDGIRYHSFDYLHCIQFVMREYNWERVSLMGHSLFSMLGFVFACLYPQRVDMLIGIDILKPRDLNPPEEIKMMRYKFDKFLIADERRQNGGSASEPPTYDYDMMNRLVFEGSGRSIDADKSHHILDRSITKSTKFPQRYYFSRDERIKFYEEFVASPRFSDQLAARLKAPYLCIKGRQSDYLGESNFDETVEILRKTGQFQLHFLAEGTHHLHLNHAEKVASIVNPFVQKYRPPGFELRCKL